ncbi:putative type IX secretion system sortase PorU2 [Portibacter marinus]|uniref:putative type IX secretion system sortase PorU2 n=1 Tax=Portibacter marinus TaxID=2898660 RepID=UPI001F16A867|nr:C25 family cysteine peptidase [Portibacter marinus]
MNKILLLFLFASIIPGLNAQFVSEGGDTLYGNEWINYDQEYYKISVAEDGIYRITLPQLGASGIPAGSLEGANYQLYHNGKAYPIYVSNQGRMGDGDYIEFYGRKNRGELDAIFYQNPEIMQLNPEYSLFTDTAAYFLTWNNGDTNLRVNEVISQEVSGPFESFYMHKERQVLSNRVHKPTHNGSDNVRYSHFDVGEGFGGPLRQNNEVTLAATNIVEAGLTPSVDIRFTTNSTAHKIDFLLNGEVKKLYEHSGYRVYQDNIDFNISELKSNNRIRLEGKVDQFDRNIMAIVDLNYPRAFDFGNEQYFEFYIKGDFTERFVEVDRFDGGSKPVIYDPATASRIIPEEINGKYRFVIPASDEDRYMIAYHSGEAIIRVAEMEKMPFVDYRNMDGDFIIISHPRLMEGSTNQVEAYASYRSSAAGGNYNSVVVNVEDLYEQFSYGVHRHSYSVKNFVNWVTKNWSNPKYVFLVGKAREYAVYRTQEQIDNPINQDFTVPTYGYPGSDNLLTSNGNYSSYALLSSGRIGTRISNDLAIYLNKIQEHESFRSLPQTIEDKAWTKKIVHLSGGDPNIQEFLFNSLESMRSEIEKNKFGADVETVRKYSAEPIQSSLSEGILDIINNGVAMMTFFGHSAVGTFDFSIEDPSAYDNKGKYPFMISLGCHSGNVHTSTLGVSEDFVIEEDRGAISFLASSGAAYISIQRSFGERFYEYLGTDYYGLGIGDALRAVIKTWNDIEGISTKILMEQLTYHGDPALRLQHYEGPDFIVDHETVATLPKIVSTNIDSFSVHFDVVNIGKKSDDDSLQITLNHYLPNDSLRYAVVTKIEAPHSRSSITLKIPQPGLSGLGRNSIEITLDADDQIQELPSPVAESNNTLSRVNNGQRFSFFVLDQGATTIFPANKSVLNSECPFSLKASTSNVFLERQTYVFQIDTTLDFNSAQLRENKVEASGGIIEWAPEFQLENNTVYYWRVSPDSLNPEVGYIWNSSSFIYLENGNLGYNSSHLYQIQENEGDTYGLRDNRQWEFVREPHDLRFDLGLSTESRRWLLYDGQPFGSLNHSNFGSYLSIHARDLYTWSVRNDDPSKYGALPTQRDIFAWNMDKIEDRKNFIEVLSMLPEGTRVCIYTILIDDQADLKTEEWEQDSIQLGYNMFSVLESLGAEKIRDLKDKGTVPYLFIYDVGTGPLIEIIGDDIYSEVEYTVPVFWMTTGGEYHSDIIGPSKIWDRVIWKYDLPEATDSVSLNLYGIKNGNKSLLMEGLTETEIDISSINSEEYPYLQLEVEARDINRTAPQVNFLRVFYESYPDYALNTNSDDYRFQSDTLEQGQSLVVSMPISEVQGVASDSILIKTSIVNTQNQIEEKYEKVKSPGSKNNLLFEFSRNTSDMVGDYQFLIEVNPEDESLEQFDGNNFGVKEFHVRGDSRNPIIEAKFDGTTILPGDIVSSQPVIEITLKDENKYLLLDDPSVIELGIIHPDGSLENIDISDPRLQIVLPENTQENVIKFQLEPKFEKDGTYSLLVNGADRSENKSGDLNLKVDFTIVLDQSISEVLTYPNPFSSSTQFIFTLTGSEIPEDLKIKIYTVSGQLVKEIFKEELGPLKIGINRTQYKWDGTDQFGNRLANGVYIYSVETKDKDDERLKKYDLGIGEYFQNNLGKMVILR